MPNAPSCAIHFLLAREAPVGVLLRRGPSKRVQCLLWNLETDEVTPGQWLKGRIYEHRCDLSPDGKLFIYFAANHKGNWLEGSWTAISRPPFLTALALWFKGDCWDGGGLFESNDKVLVNGLSDHRYAKNFVRPELQVAPLRTKLGRGEDWPIEHARRLRDGWRVERELNATMSWLKLAQGYTTHHPRVMVKSVPGIEISETTSISRFEDVRTFTGLVGGSNIDLSGAKQVDIDAPRSRIVYTAKGKLLAHDGASVKEIADLTENSFEPVPPPEWATQWP